MTSHLLGLFILMDCKTKDLLELHEIASCSQQLTQVEFLNVLIMQVDSSIMLLPSIHQFQAHHTMCISLIYEDCFELRARFYQCHACLFS